MIKKFQKNYSYLFDGSRKKIRVSYATVPGLTYFDGKIPLFALIENLAPPPGIRAGVLEHGLVCHRAGPECVYAMGSFLYKKPISRPRGSEGRLVCTFCYVKTST